MSALPKRFFTPEEYLTLEVNSDYKSQYVAGEIFAMAAAEPEHVIIQANLTGELRNRFRGKNCFVFGSDMRVKAQDSHLYTYPDVSALCGEAKFDRTLRPRSLINPHVIFEVLSPSTELFDRGDKFARYRRLPSLIDYVLVASDQVRVEHYVRREGGDWALREYSQLFESVPLRGVECELPLSEIYYQVEFEADPPDRPA